MCFIWCAGPASPGSKAQAALLRRDRSGLVSGGCQDGDRLTAVVRDLGRPNGIAFSPDQRTMYVANTEPTRKVIMAYDVAADGSVSNSRVFADATADTTPGMPDGIKLDTDGNVYATMPGGVWVIAPDGRHLGTIRSPEVAANVAWGDDGRSLYITAETGVYRVKLTAAGTPGGL